MRYVGISPRIFGGHSAKMNLEEGPQSTVDPEVRAYVYSLVSAVFST